MIIEILVCHLRSALSINSTDGFINILVTDVWAYNLTKFDEDYLEIREPWIEFYN